MHERGNKCHFSFCGCLWIFFSPFLAPELSWPSLFPSNRVMFLPHILTINILALWPCLPIATRKTKRGYRLIMRPTHMKAAASCLVLRKGCCACVTPCGGCRKEREGMPALHIHLTQIELKLFTTWVYCKSLKVDFTNNPFSSLVLAWTPTVALCSDECDVKIKVWGRESYFTAHKGHSERTLPCQA